MEEYFKYLDELRDSGDTNMHEANPYLERKFGMSRNRAREVLKAWMEQFSLK